MKDATNKTIAHFGGGYRINIAGTAPAVAGELNRLYNYGVISSFDESFRPGEDTVVLAKSYPARFNKGIAALARVKVEGKIAKRGIKTLSSVRTLLKHARRQVRAEFTRVENIYVDKSTQFSQGDVAPTEAYEG